MNRPAKKKYSRLDRHLMGIGIVFLLPEDSDYIYYSRSYCLERRIITL